MIAHLLGIIFKPFFDWSDRRCAEMEAKALADEKLRAEVEGLDFIEPPEETVDAHALMSEIIFDLAAERAAECGVVDLALWEYEYRTRGGRA